MDGLGDDEADVVRKAVVKPLAPVRGWISMAERGLYPDLAVGTSTGQVGVSSAHRSKVQPLSRSKRAWRQWQVRMPSSMLPRSSGKPICGHRLSSAKTRSRS